MSNIDSRVSSTDYPVLHVVAAAFILIAASVAMWWQPILADEWDFFLAADDWYASRQLIPHPQGYVHLLQLIFLTSSDHLAVVRIPGVISGLVTVALIPWAVRSFVSTPDRTAERIGILALWIYTLSPLTIQNMMLVDIDNTVLAPSLLAVLILWRQTIDWSWKIRVPALALAFSLILWLKLPTPILLMGTISLFHLLRFELRKSAESVVASVAGVIVWYLSFLVYNEWTGFTFAYFSRTLNRTPLNANTIKYMLQLFPQTQGLLVLWLSIPLALIIGYFLVRSALRFLSNQSTEIDILALWSAVGLVFYGFVIAPAWGFPRYHAPYLPVFAIIAAATVFPQLRGLPGNKLYVIAALGLLYLLYARMFVGDPLWDIYSLTFSTETHNISARMAEGLTTFVKLGAPLAVGIGIAGFLAYYGKTSMTGVVTATLTVFAFAYMIHTATVQIAAPYSTRYRYTYHYLDFQQAVEVLQKAEGYVLAPKDLLLYSKQPGEDFWLLFTEYCSEDCLYKGIRAKDAYAVAWTTKEQHRVSELNSNTALRDLLARCFTRTQHGVFIIYSRLSNCRQL